ncbi:MAG: amidohydrolase family protein [Rhodospirillaceae bacterium]
MAVIDIHTHMLSDGFLDLVRRSGEPDLEIGTAPNGSEFMIEYATPSMGFVPDMFDYDIRIQNMDKFGIDIAVVSLTSPNAFWGTEEVSAEAARIINDDMAAAQKAYPDRIRFLASLPWEFPDKAVAELERARELGAVGVMTLANIRKRHVNDPHFDPVWKAIESAGLPVLIHPTTPLGSADMDLGTYRLLGAVGFTFDTTLAISRMVMDGFFEKFPEIKVIASHGGGYLPYISGRLDLFFNYGTFEKKITELPSVYLSNIYYDSIVYQQDGLQSLVNLAGPDRVLFGTDYPHAANIPKLKELVETLPGDQSATVFGGAAEILFNLA